MGYWGNCLENEYGIRNVNYFGTVQVGTGVWFSSFENSHAFENNDCLLEERFCFIHPIAFDSMFPSFL